MGLNPNRSLPGAAVNSTGFLINRSLRFRNAAPAYLSRTYGAPTNRYIWTYSAWVKRGLLGVNNGGASYGLFGCATSGDNTVGFNGSDQLILQGLIAGVASFNLTTTQVFRDPSAWYHIVIAFDLTQATASNRVKIYVNGSQVTSFSTATYPTQNGAWNYNTAVIHALGSYYPTAGAWNFDGYFADVYWVDGQQLTPSSFGQMSTIGVWRPIKYMGAFGNNGFYLPFSDTTSATTLCYDKSGKGNNWTPTGISTTAGSTYDSMTDVPTLTGDMASNYCVLNPLDKDSGNTLYDANLYVTTSSSGQGFQRGTMYTSSGKFYWEITASNPSAGNASIGIAGQNTVANTTNYVGATADSYGYFASNGNKSNNGSAAAYGATYTNGDIIGVALDMDAGTLTFYKNNVSQGVAYTGLSGSFAPALSDISNSSASNFTANFGQRPFSYTPPVGFKALNTFNLPVPTIPAGNKYIGATLYTGNGTSQSITNTGSFQPDLVWCKVRNAVDNNYLFDSARGVGNGLYSDSAAAEVYSAGTLTSFNSNGFSVGTTGINTNGNSFVGWQWKESTAAGFDIVTYTGNGTAGKQVAHSLGVAPAMIIVKCRTQIASWAVYHKSLGATNWLLLNSTQATTVSAQEWDNQPPGAQYFYVGNSSSNSNQNGQAYVGYCFAQITGFSQFGSYTGNGSTDGPFIYCGFRPKYILIKRTNSAVDWAVHDTSRNPYNAADLDLVPNSSAAEISYGTMDILSNGFKPRDNSYPTNTSGDNYIYAAFAENPFKYANAR